MFEIVCGLVMVLVFRSWCVGFWFGLFQEFWMFGNVRVEYRSNFTQNDSSVRNVGYFLTFSRTRETQHSWRTVSR